MSWIPSINLPGVGVRQAAALAKRCGLGAIELNLEEDGEVGLTTTESAARELRDAVEDQGLQIAGVATGLYWRYPPTSDDPAVRRRAQDVAKRQLHMAAVLGAGAVLVVPGKVGEMMGGPVVRYDIAYARAEEFLAAMAPEAESARVHLAIENVWNKLLLSPLEMKRFVEGPNSDYVGMYFDVGNVLLNGYPEHWIEILGPLIRRVHLKDFRRSVGTVDGFVDIGSGDADWPAVGAALRSIGYQGPLTAEVFPSAADRADIEGYVARIARQIADVMQLMQANLSS